MSEKRMVYLAVGSVAIVDPEWAGEVTPPAVEAEYRGWSQSIRAENVPGEHCYRCHTARGTSERGLCPHCEQLVELEDATEADIRENRWAHLSGG
jgi:uncharacterized paraquat-inducible protein A